MSKKRRLSPSGSSHGSSTPGPSLSQSLPGRSGSLAYTNEADTPSGGPGPSRLGLSSTPAPVIDRAYAKYGTIVIGSGDGKGYGDESYLWEGLPMNKGSYRYAPCAFSPNPSPSTIFPFYRTIPYAHPAPTVHLSFLDRSPFLRLSPTALTASTDKGFRSARANISVREGSWYYEVLVERGNGATGACRGSAPTATGGHDGNAHVRVGWGRREASLEMPVGADGYSYGIRDVGGEKIHLSRPKGYGQSFATGDVIGCLIRLPPRPKVDTMDQDEHDPARIKRRRVPLQWKGQAYFEMYEYLPSREMETLIDREGKLAAAAKAAEEMNGHVEEEGMSMPGKKKATTKNTKKAKETPVEPVPEVPTARKLEKLPGSSIEFYLNGEPIGTAFEDLYDFIPLAPLVQPAPTKRNHLHHPYDPLKDVLHDDGSLGYYPMISCFGRGKVRVNFGPPWLRPPADLDARPMTERWEEFREEERIQDEKEEAELSEIIKKDMEEDERKRAIYEAKIAKDEQRKAAALAKKKLKAGGTPIASTARNTPAPSNKGTPVPSNRDTPVPSVRSSPAPHSERGTPVKRERESETPRSTKKGKSKSVSRAGSVRSSVGVEEQQDEPPVENGDVDMGEFLGDEADAEGEEDEGIDFS